VTDAFSNLTPLRRRLTQAGERMLARVEFAGEIAPVMDRNYLIKGWLDRDAVSVLFGDSNAGKSFLAIDMAHHIHNGMAWAGRRVRQAPVLYIATEGGALFANRLAARKARFMVLRGPLRLGGRNPEAQPLAEAVQHLAETHGPFGLIIVDTLARVMAGADENAAPDVASLIASCDMLRERTGAHIMLIHHSGKDATRGARGHSSLRAAVDTEIELIKGDGGRLAKVTKQRDGETGLEAAFDLDVVTLGKDADGDPVTSCIVKHQIKEGRR
jgi:hypothetical protein